MTTPESDLAAELSRRRTRFATDAGIDPGSVLPTPEASPFPGAQQATGASGGDPKPPMGYATGPERMPGPTGRWGGRAGEHVDDAEPNKPPTERLSYKSAGQIPDKFKDRTSNPNEVEETVRWGRWGGRGSEKAPARDGARDAEMATDPPVSEAQRRAAWAAVGGHSKLGIPPSAGKKILGKGE